MKTLEQLCASAINQHPGWGINTYAVIFDYHFDVEMGIVVFADNEQDALDIAADYAEKQGWDCFYTRGEVEAMTQEELEHLTFAGNHCLPINSEMINIIFLGKVEALAVSEE